MSDAEIEANFDLAITSSTSKRSFGAYSQRLTRENEIGGTTADHRKFRFSLG